MPVQTRAQRRRSMSKSSTTVPSDVSPSDVPTVPRPTLRTPSPRALHRARMLPFDTSDTASETSTASSTASDATPRFATSSLSTTFSCSMKWVMLMWGLLAVVTYASVDPTVTDDVQRWWRATVRNATAGMHTDEGASEHEMLGCV